MCSYLGLDDTVTCDKLKYFLLYIVLQNKAKSNKQKN